MRPLKDLLNKMDDATLPENMQTTSNTEFSGEEICTLCGRQSICGSLGYVRYDLPIDHPQFGQLFRCPNGTADPQRVNRLRKIGNLDVFAEKTFENFRIDPPGLTATQSQSLSIAFETAKAYAGNPQGWLLLEGTYGCGKTHLAAAVGNARLQYEDAVMLITTPDLLDHLRNTYGPNSDVGYDEIFDRMRNAPILILDDLGVENPSAWAQEKLFQLLNHRYSHNLPTVITTNADLDVLDPRIRSRLLDDKIIHRVRISAPDYRTPVQLSTDQLADLRLYADMTFDKFDPRTGVNPTDRQNLERALFLSRNYAEAPDGWFVLTGVYGCGKTHLAAAIANYREENHASVTFVTVPSLLDFLRQTFAPNSISTFDRRFQLVRSAPMLVLDDLGRMETTTTWAREKLFQIIDYRYLSRLPTVITTAASIEDIDPRIVSRLLDRRRCMVYAITAPSYSSRINRK